MKVESKKEEDSMVHIEVIFIFRISNNFFDFSGNHLEDADESKIVATRVPILRRRRNAHFPLPDHAVVGSKRVRVPKISQESTLQPQYDHTRRHAMFGSHRDVAQSKPLFLIIDLSNFFLFQIGFLHRDIKPGNFAMGRNDTDKRTVFLLDFVSFLYFYRKRIIIFRFFRVCAGNTSPETVNCDRRAKRPASGARSGTPRSTRICGKNWDGTTIFGRSTT